jgi:hypothetical protein
MKSIAGILHTLLVLYLPPQIGSNIEEYRVSAIIEASKPAIGPHHAGTQR